MAAPKHVRTDPVTGGPPAGRTVVPQEELPCPPLLLRRWQIADLAALTAATRASWQHLSPWMPWAQDELTAASSLAYLRRAEEQWSNGTDFQFAMLLDRSTVVGSCGLMRRIGSAGLEIGYWVHAAHVRQGLATMAAATLTAAAFGLDDISHVEIHVDATNLSSRGVPAKLGYRLVEVRTVEAQATGDPGHDEVWRVDRDQGRGSRWATPAVVEQPT